MKIFRLILFLILYLTICSLNSISFKYSEIDSGINDILWCGHNKEIIFALTELNSVYQSEDKGFSWKKINDIFHQKAIHELEPNENQIGKVSKMLVNPVDKNLLILLGTHGFNWIIEDCGRKNIKAMNHGRKIQEYIFHPTERNWGLASAFTVCEDFANEPCKIYKELFVTKDLGETWEVLGSYVVQFSWGIVDESHIKVGIPKDRILMTHEALGKGNQLTSGWNYKIDFVYSDDYFKTKKLGVHKGNKFLLTKDYLFLAQVVDQDSQEVMLLSANSKEKIYNFHNIELGLKKFREHSYTFLDTSESSVFLHVNHFGEKSRFGHIYISDMEGLRFSQSVNYNVRSADGECDFGKINGLEGIYITNNVDSDIMDNHKQELMEDFVEESSSMAETQHAKSKSISHSEELKDFHKTQITYNKGGKWHDLKAPFYDSEGKIYDCQPNCALHLHGISSDFPAFYSIDSAVGIIIGNGNIGKYLNYNKEGISTFLSRDGGVVWTEVRKGSHIYEIGDHGAIIVLAQDLVPTNKILYSLDEGLHFKEYEISKESIMIKNIIIEPSAISQNFIIYGETQTKKGEKLGVIIGIDFSTLNIHPCRNPNNPNDLSSDYEIWTPNDGRGGNSECLMGKKTVFVRRKREVECYNGIDFERGKNVEQCQCSDEDYECDVGFTRLLPNDPCTPISEESPLVRNSPPSPCVGYYTISKGYRKVPGNACVGGVKYDPIIVPCSTSGIFGSLGLILFLIIFSVLIVLIILVFNKNFIQEVKKYVNEKIEEKKREQTPNIKKNYQFIQLEENENEEDNVLFEENSKIINDKHISEEGHELI